MLTETVASVPTPHGDVVFRGDLTGRPVVLLIGGVFEGERAYCRLAEYLPGVDAIVAHLPGNHCPPLADWKISTWGAAFDVAAKAHFGAARFIVGGISTGALVALSMTGHAGVVLSDPPLRPHRAWPLHRLRDEGPDDRWPLISSVFGIYRNRIEPRNYAPLLRKLSSPAIALVGGDALGEPRSFEFMPSLVDPRSLDDLRLHPGLDIRIVPDVGHGIPLRAGRALVDALNDMARRVLL